MSRQPAPAIALANGLVSLELDGQAPFGLRSLRSGGSDVDLLSGAEVPLYRLTLVTSDGQERVISAADSGTVEVVRESSDANAVQLTFHRHADLEIDIVCRVSLAQDTTLSRWSLRVANSTSLAIRGIEYPVVIAHGGTHAAEEAPACFMWGFMGGQLIEDPVHNLRPRSGLGFFPIQYPGAIAVQCQALYGNGIGVYMATEDATGATKRFGATVMPNDLLDLTIGHHYDERPGQSFQLPYDVVIGTFSGDWYDAATLYKQWAIKQHWCARTTEERDDIPTWLLEPRPWLCIISRGNYERLRGTVWSPPAEWPIAKFWPAANVVPLMRDYASLLGSPVVTWMEGWEKIGAPGGPVEIFPPLEGTESFTTAMHKLLADDNLPSGYLAGFHWCYKRPTVGYEDRRRYESQGQPLATVRADGGVDHYRFVNDQKHFVNLCIGSRATRELYFGNLLQLADLGIVGLQIDQQLGMYTPVCYSSDHGHQLGYGPWMYGEMLSFIREARHRAKERNPQATLSYETPCELWIQDVDLHMHRPYEMRPDGSSAIPLFDFLYHSFALTYGGDTLMGLAHPEVDLIKHATVAAYGVQNLIGIGQPEWDYEVDREYPTLELMRNIVKAQRTFAREFLVYGDMQRPTAASRATVDIDYYKHAQWVNQDAELGTATIPCCIHSVWRGRGGRIGHVLINWTGDSQGVSLQLVSPSARGRVIGPGSSDLPSEASGHVTVPVGAREVVVVVEEEADVEESSGYDGHPAAT